MSKSKPPPTEELIAGAQALRKSPKPDHTSERLVKEADDRIKESRRPPDTQQLIADSENLIGRGSGQQKSQSGIGPVLVIGLLVAALAVGAYFILQ